MGPSTFAPKLHSILDLFLAVLSSFHFRCRLSKAQLPGASSGVIASFKHAGRTALCPALLPSFFVLRHLLSVAPGAVSPVDRREASRNGALCCGPSLSSLRGPLLPFFANSPVQSLVRAACLPALHTTRLSPVQFGPFCFARPKQINLKTLRKMGSNLK